MSKISNVASTALETAKEGFFSTLESRTIGNEEVNSVLASELHGRLEIKDHLRKWLDRKLFKDGMFIEGRDYVTVWGKFSKDVTKGDEDNFALVNNDEIKDLNPQQLSRNKYSKNAVLSIDTAKHLALMERNAKGREIRDYFIGIEKQALNLLSQKDERIQELEKLTINLPRNKALWEKQLIPMENQKKNKKIFYTY